MEQNGGVGVMSDCYVISLVVVSQFDEVPADFYGVYRKWEKISCSGRLLARAAGNLQRVGGILFFEILNVKLAIFWRY